MSTCKWLDLQALGSQPILPKILPNHCQRGIYGICSRLIKKNRKIIPRILTDFAHKSLQTRMMGDLISWIKNECLTAGD
jgi:hypothetical protein